MEKVDKAINKLLSNNVTIKFYMLVLSWKVRFLTMWIVELLSQKVVQGVGTEKYKSWRRYWIHCSSHARDVKARYSASEEDREIVVCFLDFQVTKEVPKKTQYPETESQVLTHVAQSELENTIILRGVRFIQKVISRSMF